MSDTTLKFGSNLAISFNEKERIYRQIFSQKKLYRFLAIYRSKKNTTADPFL
jgi:hypothetical protein